MKMSHIANLFFVLLVAFVPHQIFCLEPPKAPNTINKACETTLYKDVCMRVLASFPGSDKVDLHELAKRSLSFTSTRGSNFAQTIHMWSKTSKDEFAKQCFHECGRSYENAVHQLKDSLGAIDTKGYDNVQTWVAAAMGDVETCQEGCSQDSPVAKMNSRFKKLCSNTLAIVNLVAAESGTLEYETTKH